MSASNPSQTDHDEQEKACRPWLLTGGHIALGPNESVCANMEIREGRIADIGPVHQSSTREAVPVIDASGLLVLPGLINAHDHLEFALFPHLGNGPYPSARAWAEDIYRPDESPIREHLAIPKQERLAWGGIRNLMSGVTTVAHHNPYETAFDGNFPVRVVRRYGWAHSPALTPDLKERFQATAENKPFLIHLGEGTDEASREEIYRLNEIGVLGPRAVLVHAVALGPDELELVASRGASIVCCPSSNLFLLGRTVAHELWDSTVPVALGTDSSLTNDHCLLDELRVAQRETGLPEERLYEMVTSTAASILRLRDGEGSLSRGGVGDVLLIRDHGGSPCESLLRAKATDVEVVLLGGAVKLLREGAVDRLAGPPPELTPFEVAGGRLYLSGIGPELEQVTLPGYGETRRLPRAS